MKKVLIILFFITASSAFAQRSIFTERQIDYLDSLIAASSVDSTDLDSLYTKTSHIINIKEFGVIGDGFTDDTDALQDMFDWLGTQTGVTVTSENLHYKVTRTLFYEGSPGINFIWSSVSGKPRMGDVNEIQWYGKAKGTVMVLLGANEVVLDGIHITPSSRDSTALGSMYTGFYLLATNYDTTNTVNMTSFTLTSNVATVVTATAHKFRSGIVHVAELSGLSKSKYDGKYLVDSVIDENTFTVSYIGDDDTATEGTCEKVKSSGSSHVQIKNCIMSYPTGFQSAGIRIGRVYPFQEQVSEVEIENFTCQSGDGYVGYSAIMVMQSGNTKNMYFEKIYGSNLDYLFYFLGQSGSHYFNDINANRIRTSVFYLRDGHTFITNCRVENLDGGKLIDGTLGSSTGEIFLSSSNYTCVLPADDIAIKWYGSLTIIGCYFANTRITDTTFCKIATGYSSYTPDYSSNNSSSIISIGNSYYNAHDYIPVYDASGNSLISDGTSYFSTKGVSIFSLGDVTYQRWNPAANKNNKLKPIMSFGQIRSAKDSIASVGTIRLAKDDSLMFRNHLNTANIMGMFKDDNDVVVLGDEDGVRINKLAITSLLTDTTGLTPQDVYFDLNTGLVSIGIPTNLVTNGDFTDWTGDNPDFWLHTTEDAGNYVTESPSGKCHIVCDGSLDYWGVYQNNVLGDEGTIYAFSFSVTEITDTFLVAFGGKGYNNITATGHYSGETTTGVNKQVVIRMLTAYSAGSITIDNIRMWLKTGGEKQAPVYIHNFPYVNNFLNPTLNDTLSIFLTDKLLTIDSIKFRVDDSCGVKGTFGALGLGTTIFNSDTLITTGWHTINSFVDNTIDANKEVYFYFTYIGDTLTYIKWKIYWRE